jgi:DNA-binding transcriptional ArsR family regulator
MPPVAPVPAEHDIRELTAIFQLLSDPTRLTILRLLLTTGERNVGMLCQDLKLPQPTVSHHLGLLRSKRLVESRRQGKQIYYNVIPCKPPEDRQNELRVRLNRCAIQVSFLDAPSASTDNPAPCAT